MAIILLPASESVSEDASVLEIRPIEKREEYEACVELQRETWGRYFSEVVPVSMLQVTAKMGGIVMGAFGPAGEMLGFVYGVTGIRGGELAHWSHMLAVRDGARDMGIGTRLKLGQKEALLAAGVTTMYWTYDPLVARNAHMNLNRLGASIAEYVPDMYGVSDSDLHQLGTDRFIVRWDLNGSHGTEGPAARPARAAGSGDSRPVFGVPGRSDRFPSDADTVEVLIPSDIEAVEARSFDEAFAWRLSTRRAFTQLLDGPYSVTGFITGPDHARYVVSRVSGS